MPEKRVLSRMALVAIVLAMGLLTIRCESQEPAPGEEETRPMSFRAESFGKVVNIIILRAEREIVVQPDYVVLCQESEGGPCPPGSDDQIQWQIRGAGLEEGETLFIEGVHEACFRDWTRLPIPFPDNVGPSGPLKDECVPDKYGHFWPYMVTLEKDGEVIEQTDPGGIFRRGGG